MREFKLSYWSEVSVRVEIFKDRGNIRAIAEHPREGIGLLENWFHFSDEDCGSGDLEIRVPASYEPESVLDILDMLCEVLWPGPRAVIERMDAMTEKQHEEYFRQSILYAFVSGRYINPQTIFRENHWIDEWKYYQRKHSDDEFRVVFDRNT